MAQYVVLLRYFLGFNYAFASLKPATEKYGYDVAKSSNHRKENEIAKNVSFCLDGVHAIPFDRVCDGFIDCPDLSDECPCAESFKLASLGLCKAICYGHKSAACSSCPMGTLQCDGRCIRRDQVCDEDVDCPQSLLDESTCIPSHAERVEENGLNKAGRNQRNKRFECDTGDEIDIPLSSSIPLSKRCDLHVDCPLGNDEKGCGDDTHFYCNSGMPHFISRANVSDGVFDCQDHSDENSSSYFVASSISSKEELIQSAGLSVLIWFMSMLALGGNFAVIVRTARTLARNSNRAPFTEQMSSRTRVNKLLILSLSSADFLMGIILLVIIIKARLTSGRYYLEERQWRTSIMCSVIGSLTVISSLASVFTLLCISSYRLYGVYRPFTARNMSVFVVRIWITFIWMASIAVAIIPLVPSFSSNMVTAMWIKNGNRYFPKNEITFNELRRFAEMLVALNGSHRPENIPNNWYSLENFLTSTFPQQTPVSRGYFGYYSSSGLCVPRVYKAAGQSYNVNAYSSIVITFNFSAMVFIMVAYVAIYRKTNRTRPRCSHEDQKEKQITVMQRNITFLIATDMCCWLPICIMTFISMSGISLPPMAYAASAIGLLPINSAVNPLIYSNAFSFMFHAFQARLHLAFKLGNKKMPENERLKAVPVITEV
ncbi:uncharacterized protein LOC143453561 [Clavelina lepadiformis]|uniref:uncharacterized protein LOC143453561 n=1 Tax=Clavelina lepadiformis TaxID=159417 RepID=UPI004042DC31